MKIQCQLCKDLIPMGSFQISEAGIEITCAACPGSFHVAAATGAVTERSSGQADELAAAEADGAEVAGAESGPTGEVSEQEMRCPKCREVQRQAPACTSCGLSSEHFAGFAAAGDEGSGVPRLTWPDNLTIHLASRWDSP